MCIHSQVRFLAQNLVSGRLGCLCGDMSAALSMLRSTRPQRAEQHCVVRPGVREPTFKYRLRSLSCFFFSDSHSGAGIVCQQLTTCLRHWDAALTATRVGVQSLAEAIASVIAEVAASCDTAGTGSICVTGEANLTAVVSVRHPLSVVSHVWQLQEGTHRNAPPGPDRLQPRADLDLGPLAGTANIDFSEPCSSRKRLLGPLPPESTRCSRSWTHSMQNASLSPSSSTMHALKAEWGTGTLAAQLYVFSICSGAAIDGAMCCGRHLEPERTVACSCLDSPKAEPAQ